MYCGGNFSKHLESKIKAKKICAETKILYGRLKYHWNLSSSVAAADKEISHHN